MTIGFGWKEVYVVTLEGYGVLGFTDAAELRPQDFPDLSNWIPMSQHIPGILTFIRNAPLPAPLPWGACLRRFGALLHAAKHERVHELGAKV